MCTGSVFCSIKWSNPDLGLQNVDIFLHIIFKYSDNSWQFEIDASCVTLRIHIYFIIINKYVINKKKKKSRKRKKTTHVYFNMKSRVITVWFLAQQFILYTLYLLKLSEICVECLNNIICTTDQSLGMSYLVI